MFVVVSGEVLKEPERVILKYGESGRVDRSESRNVNNGVGESQRNASVPVVVKLTSPYGNTLNHKENVTSGQFAFTIAETGNYLTCFWMDKNDKKSGAGVNLEWRIGIAARDWESVAKKEKLEGVELDLKKLAASVERIHENLV